MKEMCNRKLLHECPLLKKKQTAVQQQSTAFAIQLN